MAKKEKINKGYYFELMDRCHVQVESIDSFLLSNPRIQANDEQRYKLEKAISLIMDVYQWASRKDFEESEAK